MGILLNIIDDKTGEEVPFEHLSYMGLVEISNQANDLKEKSEEEINKRIGRKIVEEDK